MSNSSISFDHVHIISPNPKATAAWYVDKLGGSEINHIEVKGAPQIYVELAGAMIIIRGQRTGEKVEEKNELQWGTDHFGFSVEGDFDAYCANLKKNGVRFNIDPFDFNPTTRIAFIEDPDGVKIELLQRR